MTTILKPSLDRHATKMTDSKCVLTIRPPRHRADKFHAILAPILRQFDPKAACIQIKDQKTCVRELPPEKHGGHIPRYQDTKSLLSTPALALMLFLQENGKKNVLDVQNIFKRRPWRVHHKIELQNKRSPSVKVGQQEFYSLSREYPLWAVCPVYAGFEHLRLNLFVTNFSEMVEFYRLVTDSEMESTKPDFCLFPLTNENEYQVTLCLKRCKQLKPFPLPHATLTFRTRNIMTLRKLLKSELVELPDRKYLIRDPDGNPVILEDTSDVRSNVVLYENHMTSLFDDVICDVTSVRSVCGSHDSGRYSDSDQCASEMEIRKSKKVVHFRDEDYETMLPPNDLIETPNISKCIKPGTLKHKNKVPICFTKPSDDMEKIQQCYPGMVLAHARLVDTSERLHFGPDSNSEEPGLLPDEFYSGNDSPRSCDPPAVTVTDCSGAIHECVERVLYPDSDRNNLQKVIESANARSSFVFLLKANPEPCVSEFGAYNNFQNSERDFELGSTTQTTGLRHGDLYCDNNAGLNDSHWESEWLDPEIEHDKQHQEEVIRKRMVTPVYI